MHLFRRPALLPVLLFLAPLAGFAEDAPTNSAPVVPGTNLVSNPTPPPNTNAVVSATPPPNTNSAPNATPPDTNSIVIPTPPVDFPALMAKAKAGDPGAELDVSMAYFYGKNAPQDYRQAYAWSLESAIQGNATGEENVGSLYNQGRGVHQNQIKAFEWYLKSAQHGRATSQRAVGVRYSQGLGSPRSFDAAASWLRKAAVEGESEAQSRIGYYIAFGNGNGPKEPQKAFTYFLASAGQIPYSRYLVARCYSDGVFVPADMVRAYAWGLIAPKQQEEQDFLGRLVAKMSVEQIEQATTLSQRLLNQVENHDLQNPDMTTTLDKGTSITIPFTRCLDYIVVPLTLQGKEPCNFLIDTGCSLSALDGRVASRLGLTGPNYFPMTGIGKDLALTTLVDDIHISGSGLNIGGARMAILPQFDFDEYLGKPIAGIIGLDILRRFVMRIDYKKRTLTLALPGQFPEDPKAAVVPMMVNKQNCAFISAKISVDPGTDSTGFFLIDTGDNGYVSLTKMFQEIHSRLIIPTAFDFASVGLGGTEATGIGKATASIGDFKLNHAIVNLIQTHQGTWTNLNGGIIGQGVWQRFEVTFDFPAQKLYLKPNEYFSRPFDMPFSGLGIKTTGGDYKTFVAYQVAADSPAEKLGFQVGDQITVIDKKPTNTKTMDEIYAHLGSVGTHEIQYRRDGKDTTLQLPFYDPFKHPEQELLYRKIASSGSAESKIKSFSIEYMSGAPIYPDEVITRAADLKIGDDFLPYTSNRALKLLYATGLFANAGIRAETSPNGIKLHILLQPNPVVKTITFTGLTPDEEKTIRPQLITEEGVRASDYDLYRDADLIRQTLGKNNPADRTIAIDITGDDGTKQHQEIVVLKSEAGI